MSPTPILKSDMPLLQKGSIRLQRIHTLEISEEIYSSPSISKSSFSRNTHDMNHGELSVTADIPRDFIFQQKLVFHILAVALEEGTKCYSIIPTFNVLD